MNILVISGVHGNELSAVEVGMRLAEQYKGSETIEVISWANYSGLLANTREMQIQGTKDLNRSFEEYQPNYIDTLKIAIDKADYVIDIHNSPRCGHFALLDIGPREQELSNMCGAAGIEYASRYSNGETIKDYVNCHNNKLAITYEFPGMSTYNNSNNISRAYAELVELINTIQEQKFNASQELHRLEELYEETAGFIEVHRDVNTIVHPGEIIYRVRDRDNSIISEKRNHNNTPIKILSLGNSIIKKGTCTGLYIKVNY